MKLAILFGLALCATAAAAQTAAPALVPRADAPVDPVATSLDARITSPVTVPVEASGQYAFERGRDTLEADFEPEGLSGYITVRSDSETDTREPLTYFFERTTLGGDSFTFLTHEVHRTRYEFSGRVLVTAAPQKGLGADFALDGTLTIHRLQPNGADHSEQRHATFKRIQFGR